ncbi:MAG TPA: RagB/SusD family nutrient uptake outer membrane protein [Sphingobacterium sp.]|nr:RagB/SusD family nutrient uptake outer membrane protein [Sphingobacterium sp.]
MKKIHKFILILTGGVLFASCDSNFLERYPQSEISPQVFFNTESDLELYTNSFYTYLPGNNIPTDDFSSDNVNVSGLDELVAGLRRVTSDAASAGWTWSALYNINYFLEHYDKPSVPEEARNHYGGIARFFRAYFYFEKVKRFGDVPWYDKPLNLGDPGLYKARDSREMIVSAIVEDLNFAINNVRAAKTPGRINRWAALALKSRVLLFEGTFRKYHPEFGLESSANALLQEAADAADLFIRTSPYRLAQGDPNTVYLNLFASETPNSDEYILTRLYGRDVNMSHPTNDIFTSATRGNPGLTKSLIDSYLRSNGQPFSSLPNYQEIPYWEEVKNRDPRLAQTIRTPGYTRIGAPETPLLPDYANALTGYQNIKFVTEVGSAASFNPMPIFRHAEILLNYAEALAELNKLTQAEANRSINLLRDRVGMPRITVSSVTTDPQLADLYNGVDGRTLDPLILEVRRERRVELAMEGFRYYDLMRWKQGRLLARTFYGAYYPGKGTFDLDGNGTNDIGVVDVRPSPPVSGVQYFILGSDRALSGSDRGNIIIHPNIEKVFDENKDYLYPLPINELLLNPQLEQNPGWPSR